MWRWFSGISCIIRVTYIRTTPLCSIMRPNAATAGLSLRFFRLPEPSSSLSPASQRSTAARFFGRYPARRPKEF
jgi:hypothetical protein